MVITLSKQIKIQTVLLIIVGLFATILLTSGRAEAACNADTSRGVVTQNFTVPSGQEGSFKFWARMSAVTANNDSFYIEIDGSDCINIGDTAIPTSGWKWVDYRDGNTGFKTTGVQLAAGNHTIKMIGREDGVKVDKILLVKSDTCVPTDAAGNPCLPDQVAPTVSVSAPTSPLSGTKDLTAQATDNDAIASVTFWLNQTALQPADSQSPYTYSLDTTQYTNGTYQLTAVAKDSSGNETRSQAVSITINNPVPDTTKPTISITSPANGASVTAGVVTVNATASDNVGVTQVDFYVGTSTTPAVTDQTSPYSSGSSITLSNPGTYTLKAVARDAAGLSQEQSVTITVTAAPAPKKCDFDNNGVVNMSDLGTLLLNWRKPVTPGKNGDCTGDGQVNGGDLSTLLGGYGR